MLNLKEAGCVGQVVTVDGVPVTTAEILSQGTAQSEGIALIQEDMVKYLTSNADDLAMAIQTVNSMVTKISTILSAIDGALSGSNAAAIALLVTENTEFLLTKDLLK